MITYFSRSTFGKEFEFFWGEVRSTFWGEEFCGEGAILWGRCDRPSKPEKKL
ncbi:MAG: hypothetical protein GW795_12545 [Cyanobacteria bacterium]|nr:hypothetical protein [Cyanobacteria bacterium CG_2015-16_32_12]NCO77545.1 hypothetical protein [Cyanobacteria bacterium CG_2015-22_32_23]NCQ04582.1 hypothetical protein [Cyanobacteria bacterium CG_2015-09_32_10]NCQ42672.1 hypothetical protein [Cyanobacteria bacterium CG_2015-04_32_10]NCS84587.1 hypothetical protein [Cyanobacteria bacterium CG_2015-02_32_10]